MGYSLMAKCQKITLAGEGLKSTLNTVKKYSMGVNILAKPGVSGTAPETLEFRR